MKKITVYGPGCSRCQQTVDVIRKVVADMAADVELEKVTDMQALAQAGVMSTPAVAVDGVMKMKGRIPSAQDVINWIAE